MILTNELDLNHNGGKTIHLKTFDQNYFDGAFNTTSAGKVTDFNLMMRKNKCKGKVDHRKVFGQATLNIEKNYKLNNGNYFHLTLVYILLI